MTTKQNRLPYIVAFILIAIAIHSTSKFTQEVNKRIDQQDRLITIARAWNKETEAMRPLEKKWQQQLPASKNLVDQYQVMKWLQMSQYNVTYSSENIVIGTPTPITHNQQNIGIHFYPISNYGNNEMRLITATTAAAWQTLQKLHKRPDLRFTRARLEVNKTQSQPTLILENFGLIARTEIQ